MISLFVGKILCWRIKTVRSSGKWSWDEWPPFNDIQTLYDLKGGSNDNNNRKQVTTTPPQSRDSKFQSFVLSFSPLNGNRPTKIVFFRKCAYILYVLLRSKKLNEPLRCLEELSFPWIFMFHESRPAESAGAGVQLSASHPVTSLQTNHYVSFQWSGKLISSNNMMLRPLHLPKETGWASKLARISSNI